MMCWLPRVYDMCVGIVHAEGEWCASKTPQGRRRDRREQKTG
eukprot:SAG25_NODE_10513_length_331_cov_0.659483_1_plen_41_part_10